MQKTSSVGRKVFMVITTGILTSMGSGLVVFFSSLYTDVTQLKAQVINFQEEKVSNEEKFKEIHQMIKEIHYFLIDKKNK